MTIEFMFARIDRNVARMPWLVTARAAAMFGDPDGGVPERLYAGGNIRIDEGAPVPGRPGVFAVRVRLFQRGSPTVAETLIVGPGRALGGERLPLVVIGVRPL